MTTTGSKKPDVTTVATDVFYCFQVDGPITGEAYKRGGGGGGGGGGGL